MKNKRILGSPLSPGKLLDENNNRVFFCGDTIFQKVFKVGLPIWVKAHLNIVLPDRTQQFEHF